MKKMVNIILIILLFIGVYVNLFSQENRKSIKVIGIDSKYKIVVGCSLVDVDDNAYNSYFIPKIGFSSFSNLIYYDINNRIFTGNIYDLENIEFSWEIGDENVWVGSGDYFIVLSFANVEYGVDTYISKRKISFNNNVTEIPFSDFRFVLHHTGQ